MPTMKIGTKLHIQIARDILSGQVVEESAHGLTVRTQDAFVAEFCEIKAGSVVFIPWHRIDLAIVRPETKTG